VLAIRVPTRDPVLSSASQGDKRVAGQLRRSGRVAREEGGEAHRRISQSLP